MSKRFRYFSIRVTYSGQAVNGPDEQGEICVKSPQCFLGYLNQAEKNKEVWYHKYYYIVENFELESNISIVLILDKEDFYHLQIFDHDGFFHTGDLGYYDCQGVVYFIECIANLINFW